jgi:hypothetical protein
MIIGLAGQCYTILFISGEDYKTCSYVRFVIYIVVKDHFFFIFWTLSGECQCLRGICYLHIQGRREVEVSILHQDSTYTTTAHC